ncbi:MAG: glutamate-cysteine ligase family protein [Anaeromyxobacteraceae bacterium]
MSLDARTRETPPVRGPDDLVAWFRARERPRQGWKVGLEHEVVLMRSGTTDPVAWEGPAGVAAMLRGFGRFGFTPFMEEDRIIAAQREGLTVSLEPGGQLELSGRPFPDVHAAAEELREHLEDHCAHIGEELSVELLATGYRPFGTPRSNPWMPKDRYKIMRPWLAAHGRLGEDMMAMTASAQASFDFSDARDMGEKLRTALAVQPAVVALFANSPIIDGREVGWKSYRTAVWNETDPARCGLLAFAFAPGFLDDPYRAYVEWALDVPMIFVRRHDRYLDPKGATFRDFMLRGIDGERPTQSDWEDHLTVVFPEVRVKGVVEVRAADGCDHAHARALLALWKGILYDQAARERAWQAVARFKVEERRALMDAAGRSGLQGRAADGSSLQALAGEVLAAAADGLRRQSCCAASGEDECKFLEPLRARAESGRSPADEALEAFRSGGPPALIAKLRVA